MRTSLNESGERCQREVSREIEIWFLISTFITDASRSSRYTLTNRITLTVRNYWANLARFHWERMKVTDLKKRFQFQFLMLRRELIIIFSSRISLSYFYVGNVMLFQYLEHQKCVFCRRNFAHQRTYSLVTHPAFA